MLRSLCIILFHRKVLRLLHQIHLRRASEFSMNLSTGISLFVSQVANTEHFPFTSERSPYESLLSQSMKEESAPLSSVDEFLDMVNGN